MLIVCSVLAFLVVLFVIAFIVSFLTEKNFTNKAKKMGLNVDHISFIDGNGVIIDETNKKLYVERTHDNNMILNFDDISEIEFEEYQRRGSTFYRIHIMINNEELPWITISYQGYKKHCNFIHQKLKALLDVHKKVGKSISNKKTKQNKQKAM